MNLKYCKECYWMKLKIKNNSIGHCYMFEKCPDSCNKFSRELTI